MNSLDEWNTKESKTKVKSLTCTYTQVYQVNPLMGGFVKLGDTYQQSNFKVYQFINEYKIGAQGNNVVLTTTSSCSQMSISFNRALVVFQQKVTPQKVSTKECSQEVVFNDNKFMIIISPFEQHLIDVGTLIFASNGGITYTTIKLPSRTNQDKIAKTLYDYITKINSHVKPNSLTSSRLMDASSVPAHEPLGTLTVSPDPNSPSKETQPTLSTFSMVVYPPNNGTQIILLSRNVPFEYYIFQGFKVVDFDGNVIPLSGDESCELQQNIGYNIGYMYSSPDDPRLLFASAPFIAYINIGTNTVTPMAP